MKNSSGAQEVMRLHFQLQLQWFAWNKQKNHYGKKETKVCDLQGCPVHNLVKLGNMHRLGFMEYYLQNGLDHFDQFNWVGAEKPQRQKISSSTDLQRQMHQQGMQCKDAPTLAN